MNPIYKTALIIGASKGMGKELALSLSAQGTQVHAVARSEADLALLQSVAPHIQTIAQDAARDGSAGELLKKVDPDLLILSAGATPRMASLQTQTWDEFSRAWNTDVKVAHGFIAAALTRPMRRGGTVVSFSSGAGLSGSRLSGGYAGAKRMQHFLCEYAQREADDLELGLRFLSIIPKQLVQGTEKGIEAAAAYSDAVGKPLDQFWAQWENALTAKDVAQHVVGKLSEPKGLTSHAYFVNGQGITEVN